MTLGFISFFLCAILQRSLSHEITERTVIDPLTPDVTSDVADLLLPLLGSAEQDQFRSFRSTYKPHKYMQLQELRSKLKKNPLAIILATPEDARRMDSDKKRVIYLNDLPNNENGLMQNVMQRSDDIGTAKPEIIRTQNRSGPHNADHSDVRHETSDSEHLEHDEQNAISGRSAPEEKNGAILQMLDEEPTRAYEILTNDANQNQYTNYNTDLSTNYDFEAQDKEGESLLPATEIKRHRVPKMVRVNKRTDLLDFLNEPDKRFEEEGSSDLNSDESGGEVKKSTERCVRNSHRNVIGLAKKLSADRAALGDKKALHNKYYFSFALHK